MEVAWTTRILTAMNKEQTHAHWSGSALIFEGLRIDYNRSSRFTSVHVTQFHGQFMPSMPGLQQDFVRIDLSSRIDALMVANFPS